MKIDRDLLTATDCAKYLGVSVSYFYKLKKKYPDLPYCTFGGSTRRYYRGQDVKDFLLSKVNDVKPVDENKNNTAQVDVVRAKG